MFSDILTKHAKKYPLIQPEDIVKLCYQSVFGVSHFINKNCKGLIEAEYKTVPHDVDAERYVPIGGGYVRVELKALDEDMLARLAEAFEKTSLCRSGEIEEFKEMLSEAAVTVRTHPSLFRFSAEEFDSYLCEYEKAGFPPVRHSEIYRAAYNPSYRVIKKDYVNLISGTDV